MKFSLKVAAIGALLASVVVAAPVDIEKRDANSDRIAACFVGLVLTGAWPGSCQAAVSVSLGLIRGIQINQMSMDFTPTNPWAPTTSSNSVVATMLSIPGITLPIESVRQHIIIVDNGVQLGSIDTPWCASNVQGSTLTTSFPSSTLNVFADAHTAFTNFVSVLSNSATHDVTLQGAVDIKLNLGVFGQLTIPGVGFKTTTTFHGLNGLKSVDYVFLVDTDTSSVFGTIFMSAIVNIKNPSNLSLKLGTVTFHTTFNGAFVGPSTIKNMVLVPGDNYLISSTTLDTAVTAVTDLLANIGAGDSVLTLTTDANTSTNPALNAGLAALLPTTPTDYIFQATATFQSPYYGYPLQMVHALPEYQDNYIQGLGMSANTNQMRLFNFIDTLTYNIKGDGTATVTFNMQLDKTGLTRKANLQEVVDYANAHGYITTEFAWFAEVILNNDGVHRLVDWSNLGIGSGPIQINVGPDFAAIMNID
ncbi:hypothetical protein BGZ95_009584 [Linnemannia exigua]|uniref:Uncharacterized protein n=1 Tax=Linnemannia exigua TaxID=604196 RepID=A0AAD4DD05_9FUNG|nr:hypothetical protein BGZ95_009584 [Linnemannia exigua]